MPCKKCQGFVITEQVPADTIVLTVDKCLMCGMRREHNHTPVAIQADSRGRIPGNRCTNCKRERAPGYSQCASCRQVQRDYRKAHPDRRHWPSVKRGQTQRRDQGPVWI